MKTSEFPLNGDRGKEEGRKTTKKLAPDEPNHVHATACRSFSLHMFMIFCWFLLNFTSTHMIVGEKFWMFCTKKIKTSNNNKKSLENERKKNLEGNLLELVPF